MLIRRAYKYRLKLKAHDDERLSRFAGCSRLIWNKGLQLQKERLDQNEPIYSYAETTAHLVTWKNELTFLKEVHSQPLQQTLKDLDRALKDGLNNSKGFPRYKKKFQHDSFRYPQGIKFDGNSVYLPKLGWFKYFKSQEFAGTVKNVTVSKTLGHWYISVQVEIEVTDPIHPSSSEIGIDMGVVNFATMSDGSVVKPVNSFRRLEGKLACIQEKLARKEKYSENWRKEKARLQKVHAKIARVRRDFQHKASTMISNNHAVIVMENLKVSNMSRSAKGSIEKPGRNVAAKSGLNKSILDQGWYEFRRQVQYKSEWKGGLMVLVSPINTSRRCCTCGHTAAENRQNQSTFQCASCGYVENADINAAKNILAAGRAVYACGC